MKDGRVSIRFNEKDLMEIEKIAKKYGYDTSKFIRFCVHSTIKNESIPKSEVLKLLHFLLINNEFLKIKKLSNHVKELYDRWM